MDDCVVERVIKDNSDSVQLENDRDNIVEWCLKKKMNINSEKTVHATFTKKASALQSRYY